MGKLCVEALAQCAATTIVAFLALFGRPLRWRPTPLKWPLLGLIASVAIGVAIAPDETGGVLSIFADDRLLDECAGPALIQTINSSLNWLTEVVRDRGDRLSAGQIILTGSITSLIPIGEDCRIRVDTSSFGSVEAKFIT